MNQIKLLNVLNTVDATGLKIVDVLVDGDKVFLTFDGEMKDAEVETKCISSSADHVFRCCRADAVILTDATPTFKNHPYHDGCKLTLNTEWGSFDIADGKSNNPEDGNFHEEFGSYYASLDELRALHPQCADEAVKVFGSHIKFTTAYGDLIACDIVNDAGQLGVWDQGKWERTDNIGG